MNKKQKPSQKKKAATVAAVLCFVAAIAIVGTYTFNDYKTTQQKEQLARAEETNDTEDEKDTEPEIHPLLIHVPDPEFPGKQESTEEPVVTEDITAYQSGQTSSTPEKEAAIPNFTYAPGYGVNWEPDAPFYVLQDSGAIENEWVTLELTDAVYVNHTMRVELLCTSKEETLLDLSTSMRLVGSSPILNCENNQWKCKYVSSRQLTSYQERIEV